MFDVLVIVMKASLQACSVLPHADSLIIVMKTAAAMCVLALAAFGTHCNGTQTWS